MRGARFEKSGGRVAAPLLFEAWAMALQLTRDQGITLRGSAEIVAEFFSYGINSILYQRGIYPSETFTRVQKYGLTLLVTTDPDLINYLNNVVEQLKGLQDLKGELL
ncbi:mitotic spindle assembly checkpoint protein MAD2A [Ornithorhynchus anatinus]|uniref:mitotic spindle assembly checkpoint protein MAD2A n=1 Tax=Ornithorhynchus anatinus TaxID=9258 RepID=UPI0019D46345|nr:mitotic spindle assembly checkpoint protein MAD2A [Ornithorhynchus anatinus]